MNNSVKIKFNFFSVRKYFLHINLIIPGKFLSINDLVSKLVVECSDTVVKNLTELSKIRILLDF
jgi:hypothetical protein